MIGNEALHLMTTSKQYSFRAEAESQTEGKYGPGTPRNIWGEWSHFKVESEEKK